jgi:hypothetical protein
MKCMVCREVEPAAAEFAIATARVSAVNASRVQHGVRAPLDTGAFLGSCGGKRMLGDVVAHGAFLGSWRGAVTCGVVARGSFLQEKRNRGDGRINFNWHAAGLDYWPLSRQRKE